MKRPLPAILESFCCGCLIFPVAQRNIWTTNQYFIITIDTDCYPG